MIISWAVAVRLGMRFMGDDTVRWNHEIQAVLYSSVPYKFG